MGLHDDILKRTAAAKLPKQCKLAALKDTLEPADADALDYAVRMVRTDQEKKQNERIFTIVWLKDTLASNGYPIGKTVISEHVREVCTCVEHSGE